MQPLHRESRAGSLTRQRPLAQIAGWIFRIAPSAPRGPGRQRNAINKSEADNR